MIKLTSLTHKYVLFCDTKTLYSLNKTAQPILNECSLDQAVLDKEVFGWFYAKVTTGSQLCSFGKKNILLAEHQHLFIVDPSISYPESLSKNVLIAKRKPL